MTRPKPTVLLAYPGQRALAESLARHSGYALAEISVHHFPDGEAKLSVPAELTDCCVVLVCSLDQPDAKTLHLLFAADAARDMGARRVGLVAPYLAYMRQDVRFAPGEAISSRSYARLLSSGLDFLLTVDPHLHRYHSLSEIYTCQAVHLSAMPALADWIRREVAQPLLIGPDAESAQWIEAVAARIGAPFRVLEKVRHGDKDVRISLPDVAALRAHTPVLIDDILSTARTMATAIQQVRAVGLAAPVCLGVHPIFAGDALAVLAASGPARIASCNSIPHPSNQIDLGPLLAEALPALCQT